MAADSSGFLYPWWVGGRLRASKQVVERDEVTPQQSDVAPLVGLTGPERLTGPPTVPASLYWSHSASGLLSPLQPCSLDHVATRTPLTRRLIEASEEVLDPRQHLLVSHGLGAWPTVPHSWPLKVRTSPGGQRARAPSEARSGRDITVCCGPARRPAEAARRLALGIRPR